MGNASRVRSKLQSIRNDQEVIPYVLFFVILIVFNFILMFRHEAWRDEAQAWLMAKELGPFALLNELSYEGHPFLWFYLLMPFAKAGLPYITLNIVSCAIMTVVMILIAARAPFDRISRMLLAASPLCIYAFSAISRSYCLVALLMVLLAMADRDRYKHPFWFCILIALLVQTHIVMIGMCFALCACHFFGTIIRYRRMVKVHHEDSKKSLLANIGALAIPLASALFLLYEFRDVGNAASVNVGGAVTVSKLITEFVGTTKTCLVLLFTNFRYGTAILIGLFVLAAVVCDFRLLRGVIVCAITMAFQLYVYAEIWGLSNYRHLLWLWQIFWFMWIAKDYIDERKEHFLYIPVNILLSLAILSSALASSWSLIDDIKLDYDGLYTDAQGAADALEALPKDALIFEGSGEFCNSVIPRLKTKKVYSAFYEQEAGFCIRNTARFKDLDYAGFEKTVKKMFPDAEGVYVFFSDTSPEGYMGNINGYPEEYEEVYATAIDTIRDEGYKIVHIPFKTKKK